MSHHSLPSSASAEAVGSINYLESDDESYRDEPDEMSDPDSPSHVRQNASPSDDLEQGTVVPAGAPLLGSGRVKRNDELNAEPSAFSKMVVVFSCLFAFAFGLSYIVPHLAGTSVLPDHEQDVKIVRRTFPQHNNPSYLVRARHGAVAAEEERCSRIGVDILKRNGTAVDAAIAAALCVGTINMFSSGIGGGGFAIARHHDDVGKNVFGVDFRETAPALAHKDMYHGDNSQALFGPRSVGVPGEIAGMWMMWNAAGGGNHTLRALGRGVDWAELFQPSIELSRTGFTVGPELAARFQKYGPFILNSPAWWPDFTAYTPQGPRLLREGEMMYRPAYSESLEAIAQKGPDVFYRGMIAEQMVQYLRQNGGLLSMGDLDGYRAEMRQVSTTKYLGRTVSVLPPPTSGIVLLQMLNVAEQYGEAWLEAKNTMLNTHRLIENLKFAFAARTEIGDREFIDNKKAIDEIPTRSKAADVFANITDDRTHPLQYYRPHFAVHEDHGTTHVSTIDKWGGACGFTTTVNLIFGSQVLDPVTGIIFNDEMADFAIPNSESAFSLKPSPYNFIEPGKRPLSSTSPTLIEDKDGLVYMIIGGSGGSRIFGALAQTIFNTDRGMDIAEAIEEARVHDQLMPRVVSPNIGRKAAIDVQTDFEMPFSQKTLEYLKDLGHNISTFDINEARAEIQAVVRKADADNSGPWLWAASDSRKHGIASGY